MRFQPLARFPQVAGALVLGILLLSGSAHAAGKHKQHAIKGHATAHRPPARRASVHPVTHRASLHHASAHPAAHHSRRHSTKHHRTAALGQRTMDAQRATEIQQALIQAHYLSGSPTGQWDAETQSAMVKYQADNGWQSKIAPDSRALIKLGLGPKQDEGEYSITPVGATKTPAASLPADTISAVASSEMPSTGSQN